MKEIGPGTEEAGTFEYGLSVAHQVVAGGHGLYENGILCIVTVQPAVDAAFYGSKKSVLVSSFHFEVKEGCQKKTIQKHKKIQASEEIFQ
jgi:hypothetical protein